jgi:uncharacterized protein (TIGR00730 family)
MAESTAFVDPEVSMEGSPRIAVYGSSTVSEHEPGYALARSLGRDLARSGAAVMTGGYGGIMEAVSRGAAEAGGHVIGVTVDLYAGRGPGNRWLGECWHTPDLFDRLRRLITETDGFVAVTGSLGTLAEIYLTWTLLSVGGRPRAPLVLLGPGWRDCLETHRRNGFVRDDLLEYVAFTATAEEAAHKVLAPGAPGRAAAGGNADRSAEGA